MTGTDKHAIGVFERKVLRDIIGPKREGAMWICLSSLMSLIL
jgi:hypothetical protein